MCHCHAPCTTSYSCLVFLLSYRLTIHRGRRRAESTGAGCTGLGNRGKSCISRGQLLVWKYSKTIFHGKKKYWNCIKALNTDHIIVSHLMFSCFMFVEVNTNTNCCHILCVMVPNLTAWKVSMVQEILHPILLPWPLGLSEGFLIKIRRHKVQIFILYLQVFLFKVNYATWQLFLVRGLQRSPLWRKSKTWKFKREMQNGYVLLLLWNKSTVKLLWKLEIHNFTAKSVFAL